MSGLKLKHANLPTPAKWSKIGAACVAVSAFIAGYGLTINDKVVGFIGLGIGCAGTFISILTKE